MHPKLRLHLYEANYYLFELFVFFRLLAFSISSIAISILIQDKICIVHYNQTSEFCQHIEANASGTEHEYRDKILAETAIFNNYKNVVECIPMVILSFFVGSFLDNYEHGTFVMMVLNVLGDIYAIVCYLLLVHFFDSSPYYLLIAHLYVWFTGGTMSFTTTAYRYITLVTDEANRALKFVILEIIFVIGLSISIFFGGVLLKIRPHSLIPRTYSTNFKVALIFDLLALIIIFFLQHVLTKRKMEKPKEISVVYSIDNDLLQVNNIVMTSYWKNIALDDEMETKKNDDKLSNEEKAPEEKKNVLQIMFNLESARDTIECFIKPREHNFRLLIYLIFIVLFNQVFTNSGIHGVFLQFVQKVYKWDTKLYSTFVAVSHIVSTIVLGISSFFLVKVLKLDDGTLIVLAQLSAFGAYVLIGTFTNAAAYYASIIVGSLTGYGVICMRTKLSKIVPEDEVGKIFCVSCTLEALVPLISSIIYSGLFAATISTYPTAIYQLSAFVMVISVAVMTFEVYFCPIQSRAQIEEMKKMKQLRVEQQINRAANGNGPTAINGTIR